MKNIIYIALLMLSLISGAYAQGAYPPNAGLADNTLGTISPYQGTYYDPHQAGTGIQVDLGSSGNAFVTYYSYSTTGQPDWYILQAKYQASDEITRYTTGVIGTMSGPFYQAFNGQCLGCPYTPNGGAVVTSFTPTLTWVNSREVKMTVGNQHWDFIAPNFDTGSDGDYLTGAWATTLTFAYAIDVSHIGLKQRNTLAAPVLMKPTQYPVVVAAGSENETNFVSTATTYVGSCGLASTIGLGAPQEPGFDTLCTLFNNQLQSATSGRGDALGGTPATMIYWYDKASNRFGIDLAILQTGGPNGSQYVIGPLGYHFDLYLEGPNSLVGRGIVVGQQNTAEGFASGQLGLAITMTKLPGAAATQ